METRQEKGTKMQIGFQYARGNYAIERNDCAVNALANALGITYDDAHARAAAACRQPSRTTTWDVVHALYAPIGTLTKVRVTVATFMSEHQTGTYIAYIRGHVFAVRDGVVMDHSRPKPSAMVQFYWKVQPELVAPTPQVSKPRVERKPFDLNALLALAESRKQARVQSAS